MAHLYDMIVIGGGPAGYTAALYAARAGLDTLILEKMSIGGQMALTDIIDNYPGFEEGIDGFVLGERMQKGAERFGAKTEYAEATDLKLSDRIKRIGTTAGERIARTVVIATGANPRELGIRGEERLVGRGVHYCAHCDGRFYKGKTVLVVGGGNSAVEDALYLAKLAERVVLVHRRDRFRAERVLVDALEKQDNIEIRYSTTVSEILGEDKLLGVRLKEKSGEESALVVDGVFVSVGRAPATGFLPEEIVRDASGYIVADESTRTSVDGVYAVGDVRTKPLRQIVTAVSDGAVAVEYIKNYLLNF